MSARYTRRDVEAKTRRLAAMLGIPFGHYVKTGAGEYRPQIGALDVSGAYGGWSVQRLVNEGGGVTDVFGYGHVPARQMCEWLDAACRGIALAESVKDEDA